MQRVWRLTAVAGASFALFSASLGWAAPAVFKLRAQEAEEHARAHSDRLKAFGSDEQAAGEQAGAQMTGLFPRLSFEGSYTHISTVPSISFSSFSPAFAGAPALQFTSNSSYSIGPIVRYTLWDTFASLKSYKSASATADARTEDRRNAELQLSLAIRTAYIQVQAALEELSLVDDQLALSRAQDADIANRYKAGAASKLDRLSSQRAVLNYELVFEQRQATLATALKDLLALTGDELNGDLLHPGPPGVTRATLVLDFDSLASRIGEERARAAGMESPPSDRHPQLRTLELQAQAADLSAASQTAKVLPTVQVFAKASLDYPNGPIFHQFEQNTLGASFAMPLFLGDPSWRQAAEKRREADAVRHREDQLRIDLTRDWAKARAMLESLWVQRDLAARDVEQSEEEARLYYVSYKAGKSNILEVQTANDQALQSKVNASRLDAQILSQIATIKALSAKEIVHD